VRALEKIDILRERILELKSWLKENSQELEVAQSNLAESESSCDAHCNCGYLAALEDALSLLSDETDSLLKSPDSDKEVNTYRTLMWDSEDTPALNGAAVVAGALATDRRTRLRTRRRGDRRALDWSREVRGGDGQTASHPKPNVLRTDTDQCLRLLNPSAAMANREA
jgi:hypothetical protein